MTLIARIATGLSILSAILLFAIFLWVESTEGFGVALAVTGMYVAIFIGSAVISFLVSFTIALVIK